MVFSHYDVVIRTNGGTLTINDTNPASHQKLYGNVSFADVTTGDSCFEVYGTIKSLNVIKGHVTVESTGVVNNVCGLTQDASIENKGIIAAATASEGNTVVSNNITGKAVSPNLEIKNIDDLKTFRTNVNSGSTYEGITVVLGSNIDLQNEENWTPIGDDNHNFAGSFNGNGYKISNLKTSGSNGADVGSSKAFGFFGVLKNGGEISNIKFEKVVINSDVKYVGTLVGLVDGCRSFDNITVGTKNDNSKVIITTGKGGGIIGRYYNNYHGTSNDEILISNCKNYAAVTSSQDAAAGIVGFVAISFNLTENQGYKEFRFSNCVNYGAITTKSGAAAGIYSCNGDSLMPRLGTRKNDITYKKNAHTCDVYYENDCYNFGALTSESGKACNLFGHVNDNDDGYINCLGGMWFSKSVRKVGAPYDAENIHYTPANFDTFIPTPETQQSWQENESTVSGIDCGISNTFTYGGITYTISRETDNTITVTPPIN